MRLNTVDLKLAKSYAKDLLDPIKHGENATLFWWPGSGMTTIIKDILSSREILNENLGQLLNSMEIYQLWGHLSEKKTLLKLLESAGFDSVDSIAQRIHKSLKSGTEITFILGRIDDYSNTEKTKILQLFVKLVSINPRRVHLTFNLVDKVWFKSHLQNHKETLILANTMKIIPIPHETLLLDYIHDRADKYNVNIEEGDVKYIADTYGGILQLTKEYLRSSRDTTNIDVKLRLQWDFLPKRYQKAIKSTIQGEKVADVETINDLKAFGVSNLQLFNIHSHILDIDPERKVLTILTDGEKKLLNHFKSNTRALVDKDTVAELLRPDSYVETTHWAIDKAVSRFRKKLLKSGIDPEKLTTVKGKGYIWQD